MAERPICPRTGLTVRLCGCWEVEPVDRPLTRAERERYVQRAGLRESAQQAFRREFRVKVHRHSKRV